jgi:hypothetical protein
MASVEELERRANRARDRLAGRLNDLQYHASPGLVARDFLGTEVPRTARDIAEVLSQQVRTNPLAFVLIAAGVGWLIYSDAQARSRSRRRSPSAVAGRRRRTGKISKRRSPSRGAAASLTKGRRKAAK